MSHLLSSKIEYGVSHAPWGAAYIAELGEGSPLLIKFIDAREALSVQVHPEGKTEMWYIVRADEGAELILGLAEGVTKEELERAVRNGDPAPLLNRVKVKTGESYFIPAGLVHAIGGGILVAEIQQNFDITYRMYDYGRGRELHLEKAFHAMRELSEEDIENLRYSRGKPDHECIANCEFFSVFKIELDGERKFCVENTPHTLLCLGGNAELACGGEKYQIKSDDCLLLPKGAGEYTLRGKAEILLSKIS